LEIKLAAYLDPAPIPQPSCTRHAVEVVIVLEVLWFQSAA